MRLADGGKASQTCSWRCTGGRMSASVGTDCFSKILGNHSACLIHSLFLHKYSWRHESQTWSAGWFPPGCCHCWSEEWGARGALAGAERTTAGQSQGRHCYWASFIIGSGTARTTGKGCLLGQAYLRTKKLILWRLHHCLNVISPQNTFWVAVFGILQNLCK